MAGIDERIKQLIAVEATEQDVLRTLGVTHVVPLGDMHGNDYVCQLSGVAEQVVELQFEFNYNESRVVRGTVFSRDESMQWLETPYDSDGLHWIPVDATFLQNLEKHSAIRRRCQEEAAERFDEMDR